MSLGTYVGLLRAINVSGRNAVRMPELVGLLEEVGCRGVRTYLQSGNVVFSSAVRSAGRLEGVIEEGIEQRFGLEVVTLVRSAAEIAEVLAGNPYLGGGVDPAGLHVTFLKQAASEERVRALTVPDTEDSGVVVGRQVYLNCPNGYGRTKLNNAFWERKLQVKATTRNWKTVNALVERAAATG